MIDTRKEAVETAKQVVSRFDETTQTLFRPEVALELARALLAEVEAREKLQKHYLDEERNLDECNKQLTAMRERAERAEGQYKEFRKLAKEEFDLGNEKITTLEAEKAVMVQALDDIAHRHAMGKISYRDGRPPIGVEKLARDALSQVSPSALLDKMKRLEAVADEARLCCAEPSTGNIAWVGNLRSALAALDKESP